MNIIVLGAHPDDPESGCGGFAIYSAKMGHRVVFAYLTSGRESCLINGRPEHIVREEECNRASSICCADAFFLRLPMSTLPFDGSTVKKVNNFIQHIKGDLILSHWPVDSHPDHQAAGCIATQIAINNPELGLVFYEVCTGVQTMGFSPNVFTDITDFAAQKKKAVEEHKSQNIHKWWDLHDTMEKYRGLQLGVSKAEGYYMAAGREKFNNFFGLRSSMAAPQGGIQGE